MTQYDEYFTHDDKPFVENFNDALLISNVFDYVINIEIPTMFNDGQFVNSLSPRKCGVSIVTLFENNGITINSNNITGTGTISFKFYPNFNSFGSIQKIDWEGTGTISCKIKNTNGTLITNITKGQTLNNNNLKILKEYVIEFTLSNATINSFSIEMTNKSSENRYGANVKINTVDGLETRLESIENDSRWTDNRNPLSTQISVSSSNPKDLNNIIDNGFYYTSSNDVVQYISNTPNDLNGKSFYLFVLKKNNGAYTEQILTRYDDSKTWIRIQNNGTWSDWKGISLDGHTHTKSNITDFSHTHTKSNITDFSHTHGNISNDGKISTTSSDKMLYFTGVGVSSNSLYKSDKLTSDVIIDGTAHSNIGSSANANQSLINSKIDEKIGQKVNVNQGTEINKNVVTNSNGNITTEDKPTIPSHTSDLVNDGDDGTNVFVKNNDSRLSNSRTPNSHTHGNITNAGAIGSTANLPIITTTSGKLTTGSFGTSANTFCQGNDSRLSNARTPTSHTHGNITNDGKIGSEANKIITTTTNGVLQASDSITKSKISDFPTTMTPTSHTHGNVTNDGKLGTANAIVITDSNKNITASTTITKSKISDFPTTMTPSSHTHGNVTNDGKIGTASDKIIVTGTNGILQTTDTITKSKISDFPTTMTPSSHTHGNLTNDGKVGTSANYFVYTTTNGAITSKQKIGNITTNGAIGSTANLPLLTTTNGVITVGSFGTSANTFCQGNDSRLSDTRTPKSHTHGNVTNDGKIGSASGKIVVTGDNGVLQGADTITKSKISDFPTTMTPSSHSHGSITNDGKIGTVSGKIITTTTNGVLQASDTITKSKISDFPTTMTPTSHSHGNITNDGKIGSTSGKIVVTGTNGVLQGVDTITSAKISDLIDKIYPVGSIYMSVNSTSPSVLFGGTWEQLTDTFLYASQTADTDATTATGGSANAIVVSHSHSPTTSNNKFLVSQDNIAVNATKRAWNSTNTSGTYYVYDAENTTTGINQNANTTTVGSSGTGKNMPPYMKVYMWKRTA